MASVEVNQMLAAAAAACEDKKAEDIRILALDPSESGLTDYFLICTGTNDRQTVAITDEIEIRLKRDFSTYPNSVEGRQQGEWILMDYVDFIVHVFLPEKRAFYGLERLRKSATTLSIDDLNSEIKKAIAAHRPATDRTGKSVTVKKSVLKKAAKASTKKAAAETPATTLATAEEDEPQTPEETSVKVVSRKTTAKKAAARKSSAKKAGAKGAAAKSSAAKKRSAKRTGTDEVI